MHMSVIHDPAHWRLRAAKLRATATGPIAAEAKEALLKIAADYDRLAECAVARLQVPSDH
jgi:hypothetical protein